MKKYIFIILLIILLFTFTGCSSGTDSTYDHYINMVRTGYLGDFIDVSVSNLFDKVYPGGIWDGGETDDGEIIIEYGCDAEEKIVVQFTIIDDNNFKVSAINVDGVGPQNAGEAAEWIYQNYIIYYGNHYSNVDFAYETMEGNIENILLGISCEVAEKIKNPTEIEISQYFDKSIEQIASELMMKKGIDFFYKGNGFKIFYDNDNQRIATVKVTDAKFVNVFGINIDMDLQFAKEKLSTDFTIVDDIENEYSSKNIMFIKNGSEDLLSITYDKETLSINEITYVFNGLEGCALSGIYADTPRETVVQWHSDALSIAKRWLNDNLIVEGNAHFSLYEHDIYSYTKIYPGMENPPYAYIAYAHYFYDDNITVKTIKLMIGKYTGKVTVLEEFIDRKDGFIGRQLQ